MNKIKKKIGKRMKYNHKRAFFGMFLFLLIIGFGVGYAYLSTNLSIDGTSKITGGRWDVHFDNIDVGEYSVSATTEPTISNQTTVNFGVELKEPGDAYLFTIDLVNNGTIDAKIEDINILPTLTSEQQNYFAYSVTYIDMKPIKVNDSIPAGTKETLLVMFRYLDQPDNSLYPNDDVNFSFSVSLNVVQGSGTPIRNYLYTIDSSSTIFNGVPLPNNITTYNSYKLANAVHGYDVFLRHSIVSGNVERTDIGFILNDKVYYLWGTSNIFDPIDGGLINSAELFSKMNKKTLDEAFGSSNCSENDIEYSCVDLDSGMNAVLYSMGRVFVNNDNYSCDTFTESSCQLI